jgi:6-phosphofructo-2-kinase/fructose-2,6-biphosphatase 2
MNLHISPRTIYLCRIGETLDDIEERVGGDSKLSAKGLLHAEKLAEFFMKEIEG